MNESGRFETVSEVQFYLEPATDDYGACIHIKEADRHLAEAMADATDLPIWVGDDERPTWSYRGELAQHVANS